MRNFLTIIFLILSLNSLCQNQSLQLIQQAAKKVGIQSSNIFSRLSISQKFENGTLIVIPEIAEEGDGYITFNSNIILINDKTGEVKAKFIGQKDWFIDAVAIDKIEIEPRLYQLNETTIAFGLNLFYSNQSRSFPYSSTQLSLYALEGNEMNRVLKDFPIKSFNGETNTTCQGKFEEHCKKIEILKTYSNEFADLKFTDTTMLSERDEDCEKVMRETRKEIEILKYVNGEYKNVF